jgi:hypothetical protein
MPLPALVCSHKSTPPASRGFSKLVDLGAGVALSESVPESGWKWLFLQGVVSVRYCCGRLCGAWIGDCRGEGGERRRNLKCWMRGGELLVLIL